MHYDTFKKNNKKQILYKHIDYQNSKFLKTSKPKIRINRKSALKANNSK